MSRAEMLSVKLDLLNREIAEVSDQCIIYSLINPVVAKHHRLLARRDAIEAELRRLNHNVIPFPQTATA
jgi:hypothetical protein